MKRNEKKDEKFIRIGQKIFNISTGSFVETNEDIKCSMIIPHQYDPNAESVAIDDFFDCVFKDKPQYKEAFIKYLAFCMIPSNETNRTLYLAGDPETGVNILGKLLVHALGEGNCYACKMNEFNTIKYNTNIQNAHLLYIDDQFIAFDSNSASNFLAVNDPYGWNKDEETEKNINLKFKSVIVTNFPPDYDDPCWEAFALQTEQVVLEFEKAMEIKNNNCLLFTNLFSQQSAEYLIKLAIDVLKKKPDFKDPHVFIHNDRHDNVIKNPMEVFFKEYHYGLYGTYYDSVSEVYNDFLKHNGLKNLTQKQEKEFLKEIKNRYTLRKNNEDNQRYLSQLQNKKP